MLLPKSFNASYGALDYSVKLEHYFGQNMLAKSLNQSSYSNNPNFLRKIKEHALAFKAYGAEEFKRLAIDERQSLYTAVAQVIWSVEILDRI